MVPLTTTSATKTHTNPDGSIVEVPMDVEIGENTTISPTATVWSGTRIGSGVFIEHHAHIGARVIIGDLTEIGPEVNVGNGVKIGSQVRVREGATIDTSAIIGNEVEIGYDADIRNGAEIAQTANIPAYWIIPPKCIVNPGRQGELPILINM